MAYFVQKINKVNATLYKVCNATPRVCAVCFACKAAKLKIPIIPGTSQNRPEIIVPFCNFLYDASGEFVSWIQVKSNGNVPEKCSGAVFRSALVRGAAAHKTAEGASHCTADRAKASGKGSCRPQNAKKAPSPCHR